MVIATAQHKVDPRSQKRDLASRRQTVRFSLGQIGNQNDFGRSGGFGGQQAKPPRLDQTAQWGGAAGHDAAFIEEYLGLVIGDKARAMGQQRQGQRRFS